MSPLLEWKNTKQKHVCGLSNIVSIYVAKFNVYRGRVTCLQYLKKDPAAQAAVAAKILLLVCQYWNLNGLNVIVGACAPLLLARHTPRLARSEVASAFVFMCGHVYPCLRARNGCKMTCRDMIVCFFLAGGRCFVFFVSLLLLFLQGTLESLTFFPPKKNQQFCLVFYVLNSWSVTFNFF